MKPALGRVTAFAFAGLLVAVPSADGADDPAALPQLAESAVLPSLDAETLAETRLFPLFSPTRRPPPILAQAPEVEPEIVAAVPAPLEPPPELLLVGILGTSDGSGVALIKDPASGLTRRVRSGQSVQNWELRVLGPRTMELVHEGTGSRHTLFAR